MSFAEFLMEMFGIEKRRAETVEEDEFLRNFSQLESLFDSDTVEEIVKSGLLLRLKLAMVRSKQQCLRVLPMQ